MYSREVGIEKQLANQTCIKVKDARGQKVPICTVAYSHKGDMIYGGGTDGSVQMWDTRTNNLYRPQVLYRDAHAPNSEVTGLQMFRDSFHFASRATDDTLKLWDIRKQGEHIYVWEDLVNMSSKTGIAISPNEKILLTGTSTRAGYGYGFLVAVNTQTGEKVRETPISKHSVITVDWHHQIN